MIENVIKQSTLIDQVMVIGENQKFPSAVIQLNFEAVNEWLGHTKKPLTQKKLIQDNKVIEKINVTLKTQITTLPMGKSKSV
ncbi:MAG: hypothetical protein CM15mP59_4460 [Flavobacteriaceae bacterium]|nr:MAG: hypothetical protein CM15mP59_4460 [Flavobacteriaceae bacterium]